MHVVIYEGTPDDEPAKVLGIFRLVSGEVAAEARMGRERLIASILAFEADGISAADQPQAWLGTLFAKLRSPHVWATHVRHP